MVSSPSPQKLIGISVGVLALSAIAHSVVLQLPMPSPPVSPSVPASTQAQESDEVAVVILPERPADAPEVEPGAEPVPTVPTAAVEPATPIASPVQIPNPAVEPEPLPEEPTEEATQSEDQRPSNANPAFQADESSPENAAGPLASYGADFPHLAGATGGCFGLADCRQVPNAGSYRAVARSLIDGLKNNGYQVNLRDDLEDTGRNVYELTRPGNETGQQYLMVFSVPDGSAIYVMGREILTLADLQTLSS